MNSRNAFESACLSSSKNDLRKINLQLHRKHMTCGPKTILQISPGIYQCVATNIFHVDEQLRTKSVVRKSAITRTTTTQVTTILKVLSS